MFSFMKRPYIIFAAAFLLLTSCSSDIYYAGSFLRKFELGKSTATECIYVSLPTQVFHTNSSLNDIVGFAYLPVEWQDSIIASKTAILDKVNDSIFLSQFSNMFLYVLSRSRIPIVVVDSEEQLPKADDQHFTVNFVQMELEEYLQPARSDFSTRKGAYYAYDYDLRHFATHVWLKLDSQDSLSSVYFTSNEVRDDFHGVVTSLSDGKATMRTNFDRITVNDAYAMARRMGYECARLYVEKILAEYVCRAKGSNQTYFLYDPASNSIDDVLPYDEGVKYSFEKL